MPRSNSAPEGPWRIVSLRTRVKWPPTFHSSLPSASSSRGSPPVCGGLGAAGARKHLGYTLLFICVSVCMCRISSSMETQRTQLQCFEHSALSRKLIQNLEFLGSRGREDNIHTCLMQVALPGSWLQVLRPTSPWTKPMLRKPTPSQSTSLHSNQPEFPHTVILQTCRKDRQSHPVL